MEVTGKRRSGAHVLLDYRCAQQLDKKDILAVLGRIAKVKELVFGKFNVTVNTVGPAWSSSCTYKFGLNKAQDFMNKVLSPDAEDAAIEFAYKEKLYTFGYVFPDNAFRLVYGADYPEQDVGSIIKLMGKILKAKVG